MTMGTDWNRERERRMAGSIFSGVTLTRIMPKPQLCCAFVQPGRFGVTLAPHNQPAGIGIDQWGMLLTGKFALPLVFSAPCGVSGCYCDN
jgi:hypothetical protein